MKNPLFKNAWVVKAVNENGEWFWYWYKKSPIDAQGKDIDGRRIIRGGSYVQHELQRRERNREHLHIGFSNLSLRIFWSEQ